MAFSFNQDYEISSELLALKINTIVKKYLNQNEAIILTELLIRAEKMGVSTHGLHYFVHSVYPHLLKNRAFFKIVKKDNIIYSEGKGGIGINNLYQCLSIASDQSEKSGICLISIKNPGKIGALRVYCIDLIRKGKLIILFKNTASTQGFSFDKRPLIGTNPICIGFPDSNFIIDTSTSTVATNAVRLMDKQNNKFPVNIGWDSSGNETNDPQKLQKEGSCLSTFSSGSFWYKSFFLGLAIECIAALAGGKTGPRVGEKKGTRLNSEEGMLGIVIDKSIFPYYESYKTEMELLFSEVRESGIYIPGNYDSEKKTVMVSKKDWDFINNI